MNLIALLKRIEECRGGRIQSDVRALQATLGAYAGNARELRKSLEDFNRYPQKITLWIPDNRQLLEDYHREVIRLFHNFLASAKTLVDQVRVFIKRNYAREAFTSEYENKVREVFGASGLVAFAHDLRNYMLHVDLPPTHVSLRWNGGTETSAVYLDVVALRELNSWSAKAKTYLSELTPDPDLVKVVNAYASLTISFYEWLSRRINDIHSADFAELEKLYAELRSYHDRGEVENSAYPP